MKKMQESHTKETVICAAVMWNEQVWRGHRHCHCLMAMRDKLSYEMNRKELGGVHAKHGFITSKNRFVDRLEGLRLQKAAGIKSASKQYGLELSSEDLY